MSCNKGDSRQSNKENHFQVSNWWWCHLTSMFLSLGCHLDVHPVANTHQVTSLNWKNVTEKHSFVSLKSPPPPHVDVFVGMGFQSDLPTLLNSWGTVCLKKSQRWLNLCNLIESLNWRLESIFTDVSKSLLTSTWQWRHYILYIKHIVVYCG